MESEILAKDTQDLTPFASPQNQPKEKQVVVESFEEEESEMSESIITFRDQTVTSATRSQRAKRSGGKTEESPVAKAPRIQSLAAASQSTNFQLSGPSQSQRTQILEEEDFDDDDPFQFDSSTALGKTTMGPTQMTTCQTTTPEVERRTVQKRARIESSSSEDDAFDNRKSVSADEGDGDEDPFGFEETSFKSTIKKAKTIAKSPVRFLAPTAHSSKTVVEKDVESDSDDDYDTWGKWLEACPIKVSLFESRKLFIIILI